MTSYHKFADSKETHSMVWNENGKNGPNMYWKVLLPVTFADVAESNSCILGDYIPEIQESVIPQDIIPQKKEDPYFHDGDHTPEPNSHIKCNNKKGYKKVKNHRKHKNIKKNKQTPPDELDHNYYQEYFYGTGVDDLYYRFEKIDMGWYECDCYQCLENNMYDPSVRWADLESDSDFLPSYDPSVRWSDYESDYEYRFDYESM
jgi:hypothetical protein